MDSEFREQLFQAMRITKEPRTELYPFDDCDEAFWRTLQDWAVDRWRKEQCPVSYPLTVLGARICQSRTTLPPARVKTYLLQIIPLVQAQIRRAFGESSSSSIIILWHNRAFYLIATYALKENK